MRWTSLVVRQQSQLQWMLRRHCRPSSCCGVVSRRFIAVGDGARLGAAAGNGGVSAQWLLHPIRGRWRHFLAQRFPRKCLTVVTSALLLFAGYVSLCIVVERQMEASVRQLFQSHEEYPLEEWSKVEPTLREGDVVLLMGTGITSWKITTAQFVYSLMRPAALRFSHVSVVVEPAQLERWPSPRFAPASSTAVEASKGGGQWLPSGRISDMLQRERSMRQRKQKRGAILLEAVDNLDINAPDVDGKVRHECVQLVEAKHRLFGREGERWCYNRVAVRRLKGFEWTPQRKRLLRSFINENVGRPMDKNPLMILSFIHPKLYAWTGGRQGGTEISCSELIVDLYKYCGIIQKRVRMVPVTDGAANADGDVVVNPDGSLSRPQWYFNRPSIQTAPFHFAEGMEVDVLDFAEGVSLGPEVRMSLPGGEAQAH
ncbi:uncharacterized protein Tco025E_01660 [Trypanosoma conorhini]|uniref:Uncharacterized protein n=1 Tax=Trypanosoma conorhini TaxID=83891 RepID=A0A3R7LK25_9TRYP|nr:uncharacterized protein Tco025E_01660 [Trypanosoma conorhini]RNF26196.1 hypothetical protein Tco025E_01660 [Trypanosoma conorhini]